MNIQRLNHLITIMENVTAERKNFRMDSWIRYEGDAENICGTACCALGYACLDSEFQKEGLLFVANNGENIFTIAQYSDFILRNKDNIVVDPEYEIDDDEKFDNFYAGQNFFDITLGASCYLFDPHEYDTSTITPEIVIEHIREVIEWAGAHPGY